MHSQLAANESKHIEKELYRMTHVIESALANQDTSRIEQEVSLTTTDSNMMVYVILDASSQIRFANHVIWRDSNATNVIDGYVNDVHQQVVSNKRPLIQTNLERGSIQAYYPINASDKYSYSSAVDVIYVEYNISSLMAEAADSLQKRFIYIWAIGGVIVLLFCLGLYLVLIKPISSLTKNAQNIVDANESSTKVATFVDELYWLNKSLVQVGHHLAESNQRLTNAEQRWLYSINADQHGIWDWDTISNGVFLSDHWKEILGYQSDDIESSYEAWEALLHPDDKKAVVAALNNYLQGKTRHYESVHRMLNKANDYIWVLDRGQIIQWDELGKPIRVIGSINDVSSELENQQITVERQSHVGVSDIIDREALANELFDLQAYARKSNQHCSLLVINLSNIKLVNEALGEQLTDRLLMQISARLAGSFSNSCLLSRLGDDEFVIAAKNLGKNLEHANKCALALASEVRQVVGRSFSISGQDVSVFTQIGMVVFDGQESLEPSQLLSRADKALGKAIESKTNSCVLHSLLLDASHNEPLKLQRDLKLAIKAGQISLVYQPVVDIHGNTESVEVLMRWHHPQLGFISPKQFIPVAELSNTIFELELWMLSQVCLFIKSLQAVNLNCPCFSINVSSRHFHQDMFVDVILNKVAERSVNFNLIQLELSEDIFSINPVTAKNKILKLQRAGVRVAIDDFGSGLCPLHRFNGIHFAQVKLATGYIDDIVSSKEARKIFRSLINMTEQLNYPVVVKHIEDRQQLSLLSDLNSNLFQGFVISRPLSQQDIKHLLESEITLSVVWKVPFS
ncbi:EAL domain-containing protein [Shewanella sp. UCD-KL21]|uniref:EAL domain-containing protein n=1 Tax=Shewanella sp. UCD-KL21 TaxID=1917164 RepID=UPI0020C9C02B|nr:EAL domain-containing protein [Shewanella sp. UCD-KL21]